MPNIPITVKTTYTLPGEHTEQRTVYLKLADGSSSISWGGIAIGALVGLMVVMLLLVASLVVYCSLPSSQGPPNSQTTSTATQGQGVSLALPYGSRVKVDVPPAAPTSQPTKVAPAKPASPENLPYALFTCDDIPDEMSPRDKARFRNKCWEEEESQ